MTKNVYLLILFMACMPVLILAADDEKYLAGAVPEVDGKVVFSQEYDLTGIDQNAIYDHIYNWLDSRMKARNNESRIVLSDKEKGQIVAAGEEMVVFTKNTFSLDRAIISYYVVVLCKAGKSEVKLERIRYDYENKKYSAEEMITDKVALNKKKTAIYRGYKRFRTETVDFADELFESLRATLGVKDDKVKSNSSSGQTQQKTLIQSNN